MTVVAVADAGPLIHLGEIDSLHLLDVLDGLLVPETVLREVEAGGTPDGLDRLDHETVQPGTDPVDESGLDAGETVALAAAIQRDAVLLTDDLDARDRARQHDVEVHGTVGVIVLAHSRGAIERDRAESLVRGLQRETSLFLSDAVVERGIEKLGGQ